MARGGGDDGRRGDGPVVVLGGTGWLGSHVLGRLAELGVPTVCVSRNAGPRGRSLDLRRCSTEDLLALVDTARAVVNCTDAVTDTGTAGWNHPPAELWPINVHLVERLVVAAGLAAGRPLLVHLGSILEYGSAGDLPWHESSPCEPTGDYARSKLAGTRAVLAGPRRSDCRSLVLRAGNLVGPRPAASTFPGKLTRTLATAERDGVVADVVATRDRRDFVDVRDVAEAVVAAIAPGAGPTPGLLNVSSGSAHGVDDMVRDMIAVSGLPAHQVRFRTQGLDSVGGNVTWAAHDLARATLGWSPSFSLHESLSDMWASRRSVLD